MDVGIPPFQELLQITKNCTEEELQLLENFVKALGRYDNSSTIYHMAFAAVDAERFVRSHEDSI